MRRWANTVNVCYSSSEPGSHWTTRRVEPTLCRGRYEGTETFRGRRALTAQALHVSLRRREHLKTCVRQPRMLCAIVQTSFPLPPATQVIWHDLLLPSSPLPLEPPRGTGAHKRIRDCNGGSPTSMRPADSYWEGAVAMCWVTAWMSRRARWRGLRR